MASIPFVATKCGETKRRKRNLSPTKNPGGDKNPGGEKKPWKVQIKAKTRWR
nr:hypothetical protein [Mycoplasmopsis bovis]